MYIAWSLISFIMIVTGRYFKPYYRSRQIIHSLTGICILILCLIYKGYAAKGAEDSKKIVMNYKNHVEIG